MAKGKQTCKILKEIRKQIAEENDIELITSECTYKGDCLGTCPKCESEVRYLERELEKRQRMGKAAVFAGVSLGTLFAATGCTHVIQPLAGMPADAFTGTEVVDPDTIPEKPLAGDVVAVAPGCQTTPPDTIIEEPLMGIVPMYHNRFAFDDAQYQNVLKKQFVFPEMEHLSIIGGQISYEFVGEKGTPCNDLEEFAAITKGFSAPYYVGGEKKMMELIAAELKERGIEGKYTGDMEVSFLVSIYGQLSEIRVEKGIDSKLDAAVVDIFGHSLSQWHPASYELKDFGDGDTPFECRCVQKIHFPI